MARNPTLGDLASLWIEQHCVIPDRDDAGMPFELVPEQYAFIAGHYELRKTAKPGQLANAFTNRRSQLVRAQKWGKSPLIAAFVCLEAVGPALFKGWAEGGEVYDCREFSCGCGWLWEYEPGEPMGRPWATPLIQVTATSEDQTENTYAALRPMIDLGPLGEIIGGTNEEFIRLPRGGRIDVVTSKAKSRLGQRVTFVPQDETGVWVEPKMKLVATTQRRGLAGMGGRAIETTNPWDPSEQSVAQMTYESKAKDIQRDYRLPPAELDWSKKSDRHKILLFNYSGVPWALNNLESIEAECEELNEKSPAEAERFFGNRIVAGSRAWLNMARWETKKRPREVRYGTKICLGFDGSDSDDWTGFRAETLDGYQFTPTLKSGRPTYWDPRETNGVIPRLEVSAAFYELCQTYTLVRAYCDPPYWQTEIDTWEEAYPKKVVRFFTNQPTRMHLALERFKTDVAMADSTLTHDGCEQTGFQLRNAVEKPRLNERYVLGKASELQKIDLAMSSVLAHEAACDAIAAGENVDSTNYVLIGNY